MSSTHDDPARPDPSETAELRGPGQNTELRSTGGDSECPPLSGNTESPSTDRNERPGPDGDGEGRSIGGEGGLRGAGVDGDAELEAERGHLAASRTALRVMRADVLGLEALGGDPVSTEYLKADLYRRAEALRDHPDAPLFFGRLDRVSGETFHVGRRHVHDAAGDAMVIDWRAPVSRAFYRATRRDPMEMARRRRFGCSGGDLTGYEDEDLTATGPDPGRSRILVEEIERPRVGPMRDIVATIQPDQDDIVRAPADVSVCVQGAPGTGKTAVGLHRIAYLLYAHAERMRRGGVLVIGPNPAFLGYIRHVLPALGEVGVTQTTLADLVARVQVRATDSPEASTVKGDARMAEVLRRALWNTIGEPDEALVVPRGSRRWRVPAYELSELIAELRERGTAFGSGRTLLAARIAHVILTRIEEAGEACDDRTHDAVARSRPVRSLVDRLWPRADPGRLVFRLLSDPAALAEAADGLLDPAEQALIAWPKPPRGPGSARWTAADAVLIDEAAGLIERETSLAHVVVDEAQDLSAMQARAIGRRCASGSVTVLGDLAQATAPASGGDWATTLRHLGKPEALHEELRQGYRVPRQILDFAARLLPHIAPGLLPPASVRETPGSLRVLEVGDVVAAAVREAAAALAEPGSVAIVPPDADADAMAGALRGAGLDFIDVRATAGTEDSADPRAGAEDQAEGEPTDPPRLSLVPASLVKGLEFDHVVVAEPAAVAAAEPNGLQRLYVVLTRAVSRLSVLHTRPLPDPLT